MPDPFEAKESEWIPFILDHLKVDESTIVIGHSSGAVCALRLLERTKLLGCVLVAACHTDLGEESERISGYYSRPWNWEVIRQNSIWILQFHSEDDPLIPIEEANYVAEHINSEYIKVQRSSHFFSPKDMGVVVSALLSKI